jgi:peptide/nickel transport system substrate-binding protein
MTHPRSPKRSLYVVLALVLVLVSVTGISGCAKEEPESAGETLSLVIDCEANRKDEAEAIASQLRQIGIQAEARTWEWSAMKAEFMAGNRQLYMTDWGSSYFDPFDLAIPKLVTGERGNYSFYSNPEVDDLLSQATSATDDETRKALYHEVQEIIYNDAPWVFGYCLEEIAAASTKVGGWRVSMDSRINLHDVTLEGGDTITVGLGIDKIITMDPGNYRDRDTETVIRNVFDALVTRTWDGEVIPEIAESWEIPDPTTYVFKIREGITFHNGEVLDADDVVFTFERVLQENGIGGQTSPRRGLLGPVASVTKVDPYTVEFHP